MTEIYLDDLCSRMGKSIDSLRKTLGSIRAGRANPGVLEPLRIDSYGTPTPISHIATVSTPDARTLVIKPWDRAMLPAIEKAIGLSELGLNPNSDGESVIINVPQLTEERRKDLVKQAKKSAEEGKVSIRNIRRDINEQLKKAKNESEIGEDDLKVALDKVQRHTDDHIKQIEDTLAEKEKQILTV